MFSSAACQVRERLVDPATFDCLEIPVHLSIHFLHYNRPQLLSSSFFILDLAEGVAVLFVGWEVVVYGHNYRLLVLEHPHHVDACFDVFR